MSTQAQALPLGLGWAIEPASWRFDGGMVSATASASTDLFVDPAGTVTVLNGARALAVAPSRPWQLSARVTVDFHATYDAGVLLLWSDDRHFANLCFERSPHGAPMVVSVVTRDQSDDANAWTVDGDAVWLRISAVAEGAYAFHSSRDGVHWDLVRYFALSGSRPMRSGIAVTFVDWDDMHKWALINRALEMGQPDPVETYSSSPHLFEELNIPAGSKGRLKSTPIKDKAPAARAATAAASGGAGDSGSTAPRSRSRSRTRTRGGAGTGDTAVATASTDAPLEGAGTHDGAGSAHRDGNSAPRRRSRTRNRAPRVAE